MFGCDVASSGGQPGTDGEHVAAHGDAGARAVLLVRPPTLTRIARAGPLPAGAAMHQRRGGSTRTSFPRFSICAIAHAFSICAYVYRTGLCRVSMWTPGICMISWYFPFLLRPYHRLG